MKTTIYVRLLNEGIEVYRPVTATQIENNIYKIIDETKYDAEDETWEFLPGNIILVSEKQIGNEIALVAIKSL